MKLIKFCLLSLCLTCFVGCGQVNNGSLSTNDGYKAFDSSNSMLAETPAPKIIKELNQQLEKYKPEVKIISPRQGKVFDRTNIDVRLEVQNIPIFKDEKLKLGNYLTLILDNEPARQIYDATDSIALENLTPGTHSIRVFATRPWGESFKNNSAFAQTTFSVLTETNDNIPDPNLPLLTYSNPTGTYGAQPFLLDFYLTNAPLHSVAQNDSELQDWKIKATINGDSFLLENWQAIYLTGLNKGENWIQLELIDEEGNNIENTFNNTVRTIQYNPQQTDTLSKLVTNKISLAEAQSIVEQRYYIQPVGTPENVETTSPIEELKSSEPSVIDRTVQEIEEPTIKDRTEVETPRIENEDARSEASSAIANTILEEENDSRLEEGRDIEEIPTKEIFKQPVAISESAIEESEEVTKTNQDNSIDKTKLAESERVITIEEDSDDSKPIAAIKIPQPKSVEISEDKIAITIPEIDSKSSSDTEKSAPVWWKKILVGMRQKLENLVRLLPNEV